jgi:hypothetical protein
MKIFEDDAPNFDENVLDCFTMTTPRLTLPSSPNSFWRNTKWLSSPPSALFLFPKIILKLKERRFDTIAEIHAESQTVLGTLTDTDFQRAFHTRRRRWDLCLHAGVNYFEVYGGR